MIPGDEDDPERGGDGTLAAEYVLGVLPAAERAAAARRIETDRGFAMLVEAWEDRLSPLNAAYEEVEPPAGTKAAIDARVFGASTAAAPKTRARPGLLQSLGFWRGLAAAGIAAALLLVALPRIEPPTPPEQLVASLASHETEVRFLVVHTPGSGENSLSQIGGGREDGRDYQLWAVIGGDVPVSLGLVPAGTDVRLAVDPALRDLFASGTHVAVSSEPLGGSPTGQPTGQVLAAGDMVEI
jgi:anti-sigma-K factor RskA